MGHCEIQDDRWAFGHFNQYFCKYHERGWTNPLLPFSHSQTDVAKMVIESLESSQTWMMCCVGIDKSLVVKAYTSASGCALLCGPHIPT